ncbi:MAG: PAS domain S-box protein [Cryomorphaceae bacterium]|nr:PAS domain S-box protein [Cryomorphaceae bacterium]
MADTSTYSSLYRHLPLPALVYILKTLKIIDANPAAIDFYGYSKEAFLNMTLEDIRPSDEIPRLLSAVDQLKGQEGNINFGISTHQKKNGDLVRMEINAHKFELHGETCVMVTCHDVTEREMRYAALMESEQKLQDAVKISKIGYWKQDLDGGNLQWSDEVYNIWGIKETTPALTSESFLRSIHPDDKDRYLRERKKFNRKGGGEIAHRIIRPDGSVRWVRHIGRTLYNPHTKSEFVQGTVQDITAQKKEEERLKLLESVVTNTNDAVLITEAEPVDDPGPKIIYANKAYTKMTGYTLAESIGQNPRMLQGPKTDERELKILKTALKNWKPCEISVINYKKNGEAFWNNMTIKPVANEKGWFTHWIAIERDITQQKNEEQEKALLTKISLAFQKDYSLTKILTKVCNILVEYGDFAFGEFWLPDIKEQTIKLSAKCKNNIAAQSFYKNSKSTTSFEKGKGLPGKVWKKGNIEIWDNPGNNEQFTRKSAAKKAGITSIIGAPLTHNQKFVGVLVMGISNLDDNLQNHRNILKRLESFIGSEINRKRLENQLQHTFQAIPDIICLKDFEGNFLKINQSGCDLLGYEESEIIGRSCGDLIHPAHIQQSEKIFSKILLGQKKASFENRYLTKNGSVVWLSWNIRSSPEDKILYASAKDITREKKLRELVDSATSLARIGGWDLDLKTETFYWSDMVHLIHETDIETYSPTLPEAINFYREDYREEIVGIITRAGETTGHYDYEAPIITAKGKEIWIRTIGQFEYLNGEPIRIFGSFQDIHEQKMAEIRFKSVQDNIPGVVFQYVQLPDGSDKLTYVSKGSEIVWGLTPEECMEDVSKIWEQIARGGTLSKVANSVRESAEKMEKWEVTMRSVLPNGELIWLEGHGIPRAMADGSVIWDSLIMDVSERVQMKELLEESIKISRLGSWQLQVSNSVVSDKMYWSPMIIEILEIEEEITPTLLMAYSFFEEKSRSIIEKAGIALLEKGRDFDLELLVKTAKGNERWVRCIGKSDWVDGVCIRVYGSFQDIHQRKTSELELQKAYNDKVKFIESIGDAFFTVMPDFEVTYWNQKAKELLGISPEEVVGKNLWDVFADAVELPSYKNYHLALETKKPISFEDFYENKWLEVNAFPSEEGLTVFFRDITYRKIADERLVKAFTEKVNILESIGDAFFALDNKWKVTYWNHIAEKVLDIPRKKIVGKNLWKVFPKAMESDFYDHCKKAKKTGTSVQFEEHYPDTSKWFEITAYPSEEGLSVYFKDISLRKETDIRIIQANERFEKAAEATSDVIWDWDIMKCEISFGSGLLTNFGHDYSTEPVPIEVWEKLVHSEDKNRVISSLTKTIENKDEEYWVEEYRFLKKDGDFAFVIDKGVVIRDKNGKATRMVGAIIDQTYQKKHEKELLRLNKVLQKHAQELETSNEQLEQFAYIASHDLQEPLRMITSFLSQLERKYQNQLDEKANQYIHYAYDGAKRMKQIILDLLEYSRAGRQENDWEEVDVKSIFEDYLMLRRKIIEEKSARLVASHLPILECYKAPLIQTLHALLDNAVKYSRENVAPEIAVTAEKKEDHWEFAVRDNGIGIEEKFFDKVFIIFQRLHNRGEFEGTGLGLAIVKKHVESWGGKIWLESTLGKGSTFYFTIPELNPKFE